MILLTVHLMSIVRQHKAMPNAVVGRYREQWTEVKPDQISNAALKAPKQTQWMRLQPASPSIEGACIRLSGTHTSHCYGCWLRWNYFVHDNWRWTHCTVLSAIIQQYQPVNGTWPNVACSMRQFRRLPSAIMSPCQLTNCPSCGNGERMKNPFCRTVIDLWQMSILPNIWKLTRSTKTGGSRFLIYWRNYVQ